MKLLWALFVLSCAAFGADVLEFRSPGWTNLGDWSVAATVSPGVWHAGERLSVTATLRLTDAHEKALSKIALLDGFAMLITAEQTFDSDGWMRLPSDERMSTLVTPTGLAIEGGVQGAVTARFNGYGFELRLTRFHWRRRAPDLLFKGEGGGWEVLPLVPSGGVARNEGDQYEVAGTFYFSGSKRRTPQSQAAPPIRAPAMGPTMGTQKTGAPSVRPLLRNPATTVNNRGPKSRAGLMA